VCVGHAPSPETLKAKDDLHERRSAPSKAGETSCGPHAHEPKELNRRRVRVTHQTKTSSTALLSVHPDRRKPTIATRGFASVKSQPRIEDLTLKHIFTGNPPTLTDLHGPAPDNYRLQQENNKEKRDQQLPPVPGTGRTKSSNSPKAWRRDHHHWENQGGTKLHPSPKARGRTPGGGDAEPPPPRRNEAPEFFSL
jgi:hypothetical protein